MNASVCEVQIFFGGGADLKQQAFPADNFSSMRCPTLRFNKYKLQEHC